jgi:hypothetical protein
MPTIKASDSHVACFDSINWARQLWARFRYNIVANTSNDTAINMLSGKRNISNGKLPRHISAAADNAAAPPAVQMANNVRDLFLETNIAITGIKGNLIFWE